MASVRVASKEYVDAIAAGQQSGVVGYGDYASLASDLAHDEGTIAYVTNDSTPANNGIYRKVGGSGAGSWVLSSYDRVSVVDRALRKAAALRSAFADSFPDTGELATHILSGVTPPVLASEPGGGLNMSLAGTSPSAGYAVITPYATALGRVRFRLRATAETLGNEVTAIGIGFGEATDTFRSIIYRADGSVHPWIFPGGTLTPTKRTADTDYAFEATEEIEVRGDFDPVTGVLNVVLVDPDGGESTFSESDVPPGDLLIVQRGSGEFVVELDVEDIGELVAENLRAVEGAVTGGAQVTDGLLVEWTESEAFEATSVTRDAAGVATSATVKWPDGSAGTFTATTINSVWSAVDAYTITHTDSGKTVTQAAVTRDGSGAVTVKPALTVS